MDPCNQARRSGQIAAAYRDGVLITIDYCRSWEEGMNTYVKNSYKKLNLKGVRVEPCPQCNAPATSDVAVCETSRARLLGLTWQRFALSYTASANVYGCNLQRRVMEPNNALSC